MNYYHDSDKIVQKNVNKFIVFINKLNKYVSEKLLGKLLGFIGKIVKWVLDLVGKLIANAKQIVNNNIAKLKSFVRGIVNYIKRLSSYAGDLANWMVTKSFEYIIYFVLALFNLGLAILLDFGNQALNMILSIPGKIVDTVLGFIPDPVRGFVLSPLKSGIEQLFRPGSRGININIDVSGLIDQIWNDAIASVSDVGSAVGLW